MQQNIFSVALPLLASVTTATVNLPPVSMLPPLPSVDSVEVNPKTEVQKEQKPFAIIQEFDTEKTAIREVAPEKPKEKRLICKGGNEYETLAVNYFQEQGVKDKNALATILGNIKQESTFIPNICEGGSRTSYDNCGRGYGLIQWTSSDRYYGLGQFARKYGGSPSSAHTQLRYMTNEYQWRKIEDRMKVPGKSIDSYMNYAYSWIGWGHHGARTSYAYDYAKRLILTEI